MKAPPSRVEIVLLPLAGIAAIEMLHTRANELILFFIPFFIVVFRLAMAQAELPNDDEMSRSGAAIRAGRSCIAWNQSAAFLLLLVECGAVIASSPDTPHAAWLFIGGLYSAYLLLRLVSRQFWLITEREIFRLNGLE